MEPSSERFRECRRLLDDLVKSSVHDVIEYSLSLLRDDVPDNVTRFICVLVYQALDVNERLIDGKRVLWRQPENVLLRAPLSETMCRGLAHSDIVIRKMCATNLACMALLDDSNWEPLGQTLFTNIFSDHSSDALKRGSVVCFVEMFRLNVINQTSVDNPNAIQALQQLVDLFVRFVRLSSCDLALRLDAANAVLSVVSSMTSIFASEESVAELLDAIRDGMGSASRELSIVIHNIMLKLVKLRYRDASCFMAKIWDLTETGLRSGPDFQVTAAGFWRDVAKFERKIGDKRCDGHCARVANILSQILCRILCEVKEHNECIDELDECPHVAAIEALTAVFPLARQQVFEVVQGFVKSVCGERDQGNMCAGFIALRSLCKKPRLDAVAEFLSEMMPVVIGFARTGDVSPAMRVEVMKTVRACVRRYACVFAGEEAFRAVSSLSEGARLDDCHIAEQCCCLVVDICHNVPCECVDMLLTVNSTMFLQCLEKDVPGANISVCSMIRFSSPASNEYLSSLVDVVLMKLANSETPLNVKLSLCMVVQALAEKLAGEYRAYEKTTECVIAAVKADARVLSEESLMAFAVLLTGNGQLFPFSEQIWYIVKTALETDNRTLTSVGYCVVGNMFTAFTSQSVLILESVLEVILSRDVDQDEEIFPKAPFLKCIGMIVMACAPLISDAHWRKIVNIFSKVTKEALANDSIDVVLVQTLIRGYASMFVGHSTAPGVSRSEEAMMSLCRPVIDFAVSIPDSIVAYNDIFRELLWLFLSIGKALGADANIPLNKSKVLQILLRGCESRNRTAAAESRYVLTFIQDL